MLILTLPSFPLLTPITSLCWQTTFAVQATEKSLLLPPKCWHTQTHYSRPLPLPSLSCSLLFIASPWPPLYLCVAQQLAVPLKWPLLVCRVFRSLVALYKVTFSIILVTWAVIERERQRCRVHIPSGGKWTHLVMKAVFFNFNNYALRNLWNAHFSMCRNVAFLNFYFVS